ncbi:Transcription repressor OFP13 [Forsythia ovata]|uniref:Transcription repressor n=1 Tax=Forsythia ovata TaxID=205694 RepID=A0ABD1X126_9LAMI
MGKKLKFPFLFKASETTATATAESAANSSWPWPTCVNNPKTLSFRAKNNEIFKTMNSTYLDKTTIDEFLGTPDSVFSITNSFDESFSYATENGEPGIETVIRDLRSDRLFFEPGETSSILEEAKTDDSFPYKESTVMAMESRDPCVDFRLSMEEMVEAYGLKNWECLEELLTCYLRVNSKKNHGYIVGAFIDLLVQLEFVASNSSSSSSTDHEQCSSSSAATQYSFTSPLSFSSSTNSSTSPCLSSLENEDQVIEKNVDIVSSDSDIVQDASSSNTTLCLDV